MKTTTAANVILVLIGLWTAFLMYRVYLRPLRTIRKRYAAIPVNLPQRPVQEETLSPRAYLRLRQEQPGNIARTRIVPPVPGRPGYGKIQVTYRTPGIRR